MAATLTCQHCKLTMVQQRWQLQRCNCSCSCNTSVTAVSTGSDVHINVTAMFTLVWQWCDVCSGNWQRCHTNVHITVSAVSCHCCDSNVSFHHSHSTASCHHCHTNVHIAVTSVSQPLMSQRCHWKRCNITIRAITVTVLCSFLLSHRCAHRYLTALGFLMCRTCTLVMVRYLVNYADMAFKWWWSRVFPELGLGKFDQ